MRLLPLHLGWVGRVFRPMGWAVVGLAIALSPLSLPLGANSGDGLAPAYGQVTPAPPQGEAPAEAPMPPLPNDPEPVNPRPGRRPSHPVVIPRETPPPRDLPQMGPTNPGGAVITDPAEEVAPAIIELPRGNRPINAAVAQAMQQELKNLMGRLESAMLLVSSLEMSPTLALPTAADLAGTTEVKEMAEPSNGALHSALAEAQALLADWDRLLTRGQYQELRDRWLSVRESLWQSFPTDRPYAQAEIRAVWLDRGTIVRARSPEGLKAIFDRLAAAGITTVFFETVNAGYPIYPSQVAPEQNPLTRRWDPLASAVTLAHERGMTLHAWVWVFAAGNQRHNRLLNLPLNYPGPLLSRHPGWAGYDNRGNTIPLGQDKPFLDPSNPEARSYLIRLFSEIASQYDVDGLHLDYIRYPFQNPGANQTYGYGEAARWRFLSMTGVDPVNLSPWPDPSQPTNEQIQQRVLWNRWTEFRIHQVNSFVETLSNTLRRQHPGLILSAAVFAHPEPERLQRIQQDWGTWASAGYLDWIVLMSYAEDTSRFEQLVRPWLSHQTFGSTLIIPGIRLLGLSNVAAFDQMQTARDLPAPGYALFATTDLNESLQTLLQQTQGPISIAPSPLEMAFGRYQALQREWHWLLTHDKLWMERQTLEPWVTAVNQLEQDLAALVAAPSKRGFDQVKTGLGQVKAPLNSRVLINSANSSYRLQVWQNRLTVIEQLIHQAERRSR